MRDRFPVLLALSISLAAVPLLSGGPASAAIQACTDQDLQDDTDVDAEPAGANAVTGFNQIEILSLCITESETHVHLVVTVAANVQTTTAQDFRWTVAFKHEAASQTYSARSTGGENTFTPAGSGEIAQAKIQFNLARSTYAAGGVLTDFAVTTSGTFVPAVGQIVTGADRAPDEPNTFAPVDYVVGARAPASLDSDGDAVPDRTEVAQKTHPGNADTDGDGLLDGGDLVVPAGDARAERFRTLGIFDLGGGKFAGEVNAQANPLNPDTDEDGLLDGGNLTVDVGSDRAQALARFLSPVPTSDGRVRFLGELSLRTKAHVADSDGDGLLDGNEAKGTDNQRYPRNAHFEGILGSTDPANPDTDGDGLTDGEETAGRAQIDGRQVDFSPTDPNAEDTDGDTLQDREELTGVARTASGDVTFAPTDPTKADTDGDGYDDLQEVTGGSNPEDPEQVPTFGGPESDIAYLLISAIGLLAVGALSIAGILWRWG